MTIKKLLKKRISVRKYKDKPISKKIINQLLEAARLSPSSKNIQPWKFKIIQTGKTKQLLKEKNVFRQDFVYTSPIILICCADIKEYQKTRNKKYKSKAKKWSMIDLSIATNNLILQATELNLGTCFIGLMQEKKMKKILDIPKHYHIPYSITIGYPEKDPDQIITKRKKLKEIII